MQRGRERSLSHWGVWMMKWLAQCLARGWDPVNASSDCDIILPVILPRRRGQTPKSASGQESGLVTCPWLSPELRPPCRGLRETYSAAAKDLLASWESGLGVWAAGATPSSWGDCQWGAMAALLLEHLQLV